MQCFRSQTATMISGNFLVLCIVIVTASFQMVCSNPIYVNGSEYDKLLQDSVSILASLTMLFH